LRSAGSRAVDFERAFEVNRSAEGVEQYFDRELAVSDYFDDRRIEFT
jgi:hypothetical protein